MERKKCHCGWSGKALCSVKQQGIERHIPHGFTHLWNPKSIEFTEAESAFVAARYGEDGLGRCVGGIMAIEYGILVS